MANFYGIMFLSTYCNNSNNNDKTKNWEACCNFKLPCSYKMHWFETFFFVLPLSNGLVVSQLAWPKHQNRIAASRLRIPRWTEKKTSADLLTALGTFYRTLFPYQPWDHGHWNLIIYLLPHICAKNVWWDKWLHIIALADECSNIWNWVQSPSEISFNLWPPNHFEIYFATFINVWCRPWMLKYRDDIMRDFFFGSVFVRFELWNFEYFFLFQDVLRILKKQTKTKNKSSAFRRRSI